MAKTIRSKTGWPGKKRTYHCGRKRCRYLKDMREERRLEREAKATADDKRNTRIMGTRSDYLASRLFETTEDDSGGAKSPVSGGGCTSRLVAA